MSQLWVIGVLGVTFVLVVVQWVREWRESQALEAGSWKLEDHGR